VVDQDHSSVTYIPVGSDNSLISPFRASNGLVHPQRTNSSIRGYPYAANVSMTISQIDPESKLHLLLPSLLGVE